MEANGNILNDVALLKRCNEWFESDPPSMSWACRFLHISRETFKRDYAYKKVRIKADAGDERKQNTKWRVHPWDVLTLASRI